MYKKVLTAAFALGVLAACAGPEANVQPSGDRGEIVTGSNIPRKSRAPAAGDKVERVNPEDFAHAQGTLAQPGTSVR
jgi:hypothetical protein